MLDAAIGVATLVVSFVFGLVGTVALFVGARKRYESFMSGGRILLVGAVIASLAAAAAMEYALITHDFHLSYVVTNNSSQTPLLYSITGMWSALQGSLLLWLVAEGIFIVAVMTAMRREKDRVTGSVALGLLGVIFTYFSVLLVFYASPFTTVHGVTPADGQGPNPLLQDYPLVAIHPPMLYAGFVGMSVPFALLAAALMTGRLDAAWIGRVRNWSLFSWAALTAGITLGAWWSYQVLGWGGYWAWDPVENAALLPWLVAAAFLHSSIVDRRRNQMGIASYILVSSMYSLTILATYFTRSGVLESVHAFSDSSLGGVLILFFGVGVAFQIGLAVWRADRLLGIPRRGNWRSRPSAFTLNNALFGLITLIILSGTVFPLITHALFDQTVNVGGPYFDQFVIPMGLALLVLMAIAPWLGWRTTSGVQVSDRLVIPAVLAVAVLVACVVGGVTQLATLGAYATGTFVITSTALVLVRSVFAAHRHRLRVLLSRSSAGMYVHIGVAVLAAGMASATTFGHQGSVILRPGQTTSVYGQRLTFEGTKTVVTPAKTAFEADILVNGTTMYHPAISQYGTYVEAVGTPAVDVSWLQDLYLTINSPPTSANGPITIGVIVQPLIVWLWAGAMIMILGGAIAIFGWREEIGATAVTVGDDTERPEDREEVDVGV